MMKANRLWIGVVLVVGLLVTVAAGSSGGSESSWQAIQEELVVGDVRAVELRAPGRTEMVDSPEEILEFVEASVSGVFAEDNPDHNGPTPEITVLFLLEDDEYLAMGQWPDGRFEMQRDGSQFLIEAPGLAALLEERRIVYE